MSIQMVKGYQPPPQDPAMDYAGYGTPARFRAQPEQRIAWQRDTCHGVPAHLRGYCQRRMAGFGSVPLAPWVAPSVTALAPEPAPVPAQKTATAGLLVGGAVLLAYLFW